MQLAPSPQRSSSQVNLWATWIITSAAALCSPSFFAGTFGDILMYWAESNLSQLIVWNRATYCNACLSSWAPRRTEGRQWRTTGFSGDKPCPHYAVGNCKRGWKQNLCSNPHHWCCQLLLTWNQKSGQDFFLCKTKEIKTTTKCLTLKVLSNQNQGSLGWVYWNTKPLLLRISYLHTSKHVSLVKGTSIVFLRFLQRFLT